MIDGSNESRSGRVRGRPCFNGIALLAAAALASTAGTLACDASGTPASSTNNAAVLAGKPIRCPNTKISPGADTSKQFDTRKLSGKPLIRARMIARGHNCHIRVVKRDGEWQDVADDLRPRRINVVIVDDRVTKIDGVY